MSASLIDIRDRVNLARYAVTLIELAANSIVEDRERDALQFATGTLVEMLKGIESDLGKIGDAKRDRDTAP